MTLPPFCLFCSFWDFNVKIAKHNVSFVFFVILRKINTPIYRKSSKWEILDENFSLLKFSPHELDILGILQVVRALRERGESKAEGVQRGTARGTAPATAGRDCPGVRSAMADTSMIPSPSRPAAGSHLWATSLPSVETRVLSTSGAALSHRARDLTMAVSS